MGSGILMAVTWRCWVAMLPLPEAESRFFVTLRRRPAHPRSVDESAERLLPETSIRPREALLSFFVYAQLACLIWVTIYTEMADTEEHCFIPSCSARRL